MSKKEQLELAIKEARQALHDANIAMDNFNDAPENNSFEDMESALSSIENKLLDKAHNDCEGSHNCGMDEYTQEFIVADVHYIGTLRPEYNRHDKTYYYIDGYEFTHAAKP